MESSRGERSIGGRGCGWERREPKSGMIELVGLPELQKIRVIPWRVRLGLKMGTNPSTNDPEFKDERSVSGEERST